MTRLWPALAPAVLALGVSSGCSEGSAESTADQAAANPATQGARKARVCMSCHGPGGVSRTATYPSLAGREREDLLSQLRAFKSGERQNPTMNAMVASLSDEDMQHLAAFFSAQPAPGGDRE